MGDQDEQMLAANNIRRYYKQEKSRQIYFSFTVERITAGDRKL
jgi:hypothetical protein